MKIINSLKKKFSNGTDDYMFQYALARIIVRLTYPFIREMHVIFELNGKRWHVYRWENYEFTSNNIDWITKKVNEIECFTEFKRIRRILGV